MKKYSYGHLASNNNKFLFIGQITFKDRICVSGKYDIKFPISTFVADKNEFSNKFAGVATAKEFVSKFNASRTDAGPSTHCARPATVDVSQDAEISEEDDSLVRANGLKTPTKKKKNTTRKRKQATQQPDGAELQSPDKVSRITNPVDEEIELHYIGKLLYFTALFECTLFYANLQNASWVYHLWEMRTRVFITGVFSAPHLWRANIKHARRGFVKTAPKQTTVINEVTTMLKTTIIYVFDFLVEIFLFGSNLCQCSEILSASGS